MRFNETYDLIVQGKKTCTTRKLRSLKYYQGKVGQIVYAESEGKPDLRIRIECVDERVLEDVARVWYGQEGFASPDEFRACWRKIYGKFDPAEQVVLIYFRLLDKVCPECYQILKQTNPNHQQFECVNPNCNVIEIRGNRILYSSVEVSSSK